MKLIRTKKFSKKYSKIFSKQPELISKIDNTLRKISANPFDESLRTHKLKGNLFDLYASKVTDDVRIIFDFVQEDNELCILLLTFSKHDDVY